MKKHVIATIAALTLLLAAAVPAFAQEEHVTIGAFADYTRLHHADDANFWGVGGRVGFNVHPNIQLEAEMSYDFERSFVNTSNNGGVITTNTSTLRLLHGLFGPKIYAGSGAFHVFGVLKGGFLNFSTNNSFAGQVGGITDGDTNGVFYPGGGIEVFSGPIGFRVEVGDLMYIDNGANHNLRLTIGPQFRF